MENEVAGDSRAGVRFGVFQADFHAGELFKHGIRIKLQDQPFQVLIILLERPGQIVTREELRGRLWPQNTFVDFDHSLNIAMNKLRDALGDSAGNPRFIQTLPRRGYRFLAPVEGLPGVARAATKQSPPATTTLAREAPLVAPPSRLAKWVAVAAGAFSVVTGRVSPYGMALLYTALGEKGLALRWLEKASPEHRR